MKNTATMTVTMTVTFKIITDIQITDQKYNEAAELFLNHLTSHYEEQLLKGASLVLPSEGLVRKNKSHIIHPLHLNSLGKTSPLYYKTSKQIHNALPPHPTAL
ncbi:hypothetical protein B0A56_00620 [Flavobacterium columnare NBRC 100251 = ATCC 23463]|nr:hypothetical protein B0A56_00620 [Flavobacterium columnare NBRC 100251 = ATCC 23463]